MEDLDEDLPRDGHPLAVTFWRWLPALLLILSVRTYAFEPYSIPSGSMLPTLEVGDRVIVDKYSYGLWVPATGVSIPLTSSLWIPPRFEILNWGDPERGDIIVFRYPQDESQIYIKRVVGVPGDRIAVRDNTIWRNGAPLSKTAEGTGEAVAADCRKERKSVAKERFGSRSEGSDHTIFLDEPGGPLSDWPPQGDLEVPEGMVFVMGDNRDDSADSRVWGLVRYDQIEGKARATLFSLDPCEGKVRGEKLGRSLYQDGG